MPKRGVAIACSHCNGSHLQDTMGGPIDCIHCENGSHWLYVDSGRIARYRGGPLVGRLPKAGTGTVANAIRENP